MENEALLQRQRVKELEDYLDNLLLRVMETHPKLLQNPYSRTTSAKRFVNLIDWILIGTIGILQTQFD